MVNMYLAYRFCQALKPTSIFSSHKDNTLEHLGNLSGSVFLMEITDLGIRGKHI